MVYATNKVQISTLHVANCEANKSKKRKNQLQFHNKKKQPPNFFRGLFLFDMQNKNRFSLFPTRRQVNSLDKVFLEEEEQQDDGEEHKQ